MKEVLVQRVSTGTVYRLFFRGLLCAFIPIGALIGILSALGFSNFTWNNEPLTGVAALIGGPLMGLLWALVGTAFFGSVAALGLWIHSKFATLKIKYEELEQQIGA